MALKIMANSGAYGIFAEVNAQVNSNTGGRVYSDTEFESSSVPNERPGRYCNPIIASFVTGGARLLLAMLECEVTKRGGTYAFCDTDSLAIVTAPTGSLSVPSIPTDSVLEVVHLFDRLNPYDRAIAPAVLKVEQEDLMCWAVSAKRYCLYRVDHTGSVEIVKASESGLGAILGRSGGENTAELAKRVWGSILAQEGIGADAGARAGFDVALRRRFPLAQPHVLKRSAIVAYNRGKPYGQQIKPYNFLQVLTAAMDGDVLPVAPFEKGDAHSRTLPWMDLHTGDLIAIDWNGNGHAGSIPVMRMDEYIDTYAIHPESKAAGTDGRTAGTETRGLLHRAVVRMVKHIHIGKEVDRLDEDSGTLLERAGPDIALVSNGLSTAEISVIQKLSRQAVADHVEMSRRRLQDVLMGRSRPRGWRLDRLRQIAAENREFSDSR
jgi:hypothetical protein